MAASRPMPLKMVSRLNVGGQTTGIREKKLSGWGVLDAAIILPLESREIT
jgi:hypothetical protein